MTRLWVFGAIPPEPTGGVSTFVERLIWSAPVPVAGIVDPYFGRKNSVPVDHIFPDKPGLPSKIKVISYLWRLKSCPVLINVSRPRGVLALSPFLLGRQAPTFLILHHGNLQKPSTGLERFALKRALMVCTFVGCLSEKQRDFYRALGIPEDRLMLLDSYLPPIAGDVDEAAPPLLGVLEWLKKGSGPVIIASGYSEQYYNHDWLFDAMDNRSELAGVRLLLCCYGPKNPLLDSLMRRASGCDRTFCVYGLSPVQFSVVLDRADIYVRPTDVDSFGIAVWDAARMGISIVASDACMRPSQALTHPVGDQSAFEDQLIKAVKGLTGIRQKIEIMKGRMGLKSFLSAGNFLKRSSE